MSETAVDDSAREVFLNLIGHTRVGHGSHWGTKGRAEPLPQEHLDIDLSAEHNLKTAQMVSPIRLRNIDYKTALLRRILHGDAHISQKVFKILGRFGYEITYKQPENPSHYILAEDEWKNWPNIISQRTLDNCF